jgi:hypothetical protein
VDKKDWLGLCGCGAVTALSTWGVYRLGAHDASRRVIHRVTVECRSIAQFEYRASGSTEPMHLICEPGRSVKISDTDPGAIVLR